MNGVNQTKVNDWEQLNRELENIRKLLVDLPYYRGNGSPENVVSAKLGSYYSDLTNGDIYGKKSNDGGNSGWVLLTESVTSGIVASSGATQALATELKASINIVSTCAVSLHAVKLNSALAKQQVRNDGAFAMAVYPPTNGYINGLAQNDYFIVLPGNTITFVHIDSTHAKTLETGDQQTNFMTLTITSRTSNGSTTVSSGFAKGRFKVDYLKQYYFEPCISEVFANDTRSGMQWNVEGISILDNTQSLPIAGGSGTLIPNVQAYAVPNSISSGGILKVIHGSDATTGYQVGGSWIPLNAKPTSYI